MFLSTAARRARLAARNARACRYVHRESTGSTATDKAYSHTLLLPKTSFPQREVDPLAKEALLREKTCDGLYRWQRENVDGPSFVLHDGPPYANGSLHMGHALNKIIKDITCRFHLSLGHKIHYVPGWDCHGLPIENKALQSVPNPSALTPSAVRDLARQTAREAVDIQKAQYRDFGIMADWDNPGGTYRTLDHDYEMRQLRVFQELVRRGLIFRNFRPVHYSPSSRSALAEAELVYRDDHVSHAVFVVCRIVPADAHARFGAEHGDVRGLVWTTTPWTLTANMAIAVHAYLDYHLVSTEDDVKYIVGADRLRHLKRILGNTTILKTIRGSTLDGMRYLPLFSTTATSHVPTEAESLLPIVCSGHVTSESGTGLVHCAPAHGAEDYALFRDLGMLSERPTCHVGPGGMFTPVVKDAFSSGGVDTRDPAVDALVGKDVLNEGSRAIVEILKERGMLLAVERHKHRYPYDWKTDKPTIVTATEQWFANLDGIKDRALRALEDVTFYPPQSRNRLESFVRQRSEWCISRQRVWGVPIPSLRHVPSGTDVLTASSLDHILKILDERGVAHWWDAPADEFVPPELMLDAHGQSTAGQWEKGKDTMDVWFDSGTSWAMLPSRETERKAEVAGAGVGEIGRPRADVVVEGSDQHRGWFQSLLLTAVGASDEAAPRAPYGAVLTHGMVLDEKGKKMSKSLGNVIDPLVVVRGGPNQDKEPAYGADGLRLWASMVEFSGHDMAIGPTQLTHVAYAHRKIRNTIRFLLANVGTAGHIRDTDLSIPRDELGLGERYVMHRLYELEQTALEGYRTFDFGRVASAVTNFVTTTLSALYFEFTKDSLYADARDAPTRKAILATMRYSLCSLLHVVAPITPYLAEEAHHHFMHGSADGIATSASLFQEKWVPLDKSWKDPSSASDMDALSEIRNATLALLERARKQKLIRSAMAAGVEIQLPDGEPQDQGIVKLLQREEEFLKTLFGVSDLTIVYGPSPLELNPIWDVPFGQALPDVRVRVRPALGEKCPRCWAFTRVEEKPVCDRCAEVLEAETHNA